MPAAAAYASVRTLQVVELWRAGRWGPEAGPLVRHDTRWHGAAVLLWWLGMRITEPAAFIMTRRTLLNVKERAEALRASTRSTDRRS